MNNRGQVLLVQAYNGVDYFVYDPIRKDMIPVDQNGKVAEGGTIRTVHLVYLTGLDDEGRLESTALHMVLVRWWARP